MTSISDTNVVNAPGGLVELGYKEVTSPVTVTGTQAAQTTIVSPMTVVCDGSPIFIEFFSPYTQYGSTAGNWCVFSLWVDGVLESHLSENFYFASSLGIFDGGPGVGFRRLTPSAGVHTFEIRAWRNNANVTVGTGSGYSPIYLRVSKIIQASQLIVQTPNAPLVTSLPSNAIDGQEVRYLADSTNGIIWNFRYRAGSSSAYKWEFIGGPPISTQHNDGTQYTLTHAAGTYSDVLTKAIPLAGDYLINGACLLTTTSGNDAIICINTTASRNINYYVARMSNGASQYENGNRTVVLTALAANVTIALSDYHVAQGSGSTVGNANLVITPIRVSA